jgi:hypothetical protein
MCPRCHKVLEEDEICCGQLLFTWRCTTCFKLGAGCAIPYGNCFLCGGPLEVIPHRVDEAARHIARDAVELQLSLFNYYRLARDRAARSESRKALDWLCETALDHLHELEDRYRAHLDRDMAELVSHEEQLTGHWALRGVLLSDDAELAELFEYAMDVERRVRDHFRRLESEFPGGIENDVCRELEADADEDMAMIQTEIQQLA